MFHPSPDFIRGRKGGTELPRIAKQLTDLEVKKLITNGRYAVGGVPGLYKQVRSPLSASWVFRVQLDGRVRELGLGSCVTVSLKNARDKARELRRQLDEGIDPLTQKRADKIDRKVRHLRTKTFDEVATLYIASVQQQGRNSKSRAQRESSLAAYVSPQIGDMNCADIQTADLVSVLEPIWQTKTETASRIRGRIEKILSYATTSGYRSGENPARYRGHLDTILPPPSKLKSKLAQPALDYLELAEFMFALRRVDSVAARCLEFMILTATRQGEARGLLWSELDFSKNLWTIPAARMKAAREHVVPLTPRCLDILRNITRRDRSPYVFASARGGKLSDATTGKVVRSLHAAEIANGRRGFVDRRQDARIVVPHGFRSTFRDWAAERTSYPREVIEHCLAHQLKDRAEAAYQRSTILPKRVKLMGLFDEFCNVLPRDSLAGDVHPIGEQLVPA